MKSFSNITFNFVGILHLLVDSIGIIAYTLVYKKVCVTE